MVNEAIVTV